jgi:hypothetical protein
MNSSRTSEQGNVLLTAMLLVGLVGLMATAYMKLASRQHYLSARSQMWNSEIPIAEAGIEEAMTHINSGITNFACNGWILSGAVYAKQRNLGDGYFYATISAAQPPTLVSIGFARIPTQTNYTQRTVMVTTKKGFPNFAILAKESVDLNGGIHVDSFDSSNPLYSTFGLYDPMKARDQARVGCNSTAAKCIDANSGLCSVAGYVATGAGGTAIGSVGDFAWIANKANHNKVQPGHQRDDLNQAISDVGVPFTGGYVTPSSGTVLGTNYTYVIGDGKYWMPSCNLSGQSMIIIGKATLYVAGDFAVGSKGSINIMPGAKLDLYVGGPTLSLGGNGVINSSGIARNFSVWGLPTLTTASYGGNAACAARIYVPQADFVYHGTTDFYGAIVANSFTIKGSVGFHYDESLGRGEPLYQIAYWEEL